MAQGKQIKSLSAAFRESGQYKIVAIQNSSNTKKAVRNTKK